MNFWALTLAASRFGDLVLASVINLSAALWASLALACVVIIDSCLSKFETRFRIVACLWLWVLLSFLWTILCPLWSIISWFRRADDGKENFWVKGKKTFCSLAEGIKIIQADIYPGTESTLSLVHYDFSLPTIIGYIIADSLLLFRFWYRERVTNIHTVTYLFIEWAGYTDF